MVAADASQSDAARVLAKLYSEQGDDAKAEEVLAKGIQANAKNIPLRGDSASILIKRNRIEEAEQQYTEIVAIAPDKLEYRAHLAAFTLREAIQANLEDEQRYLLLAKFLATHKGVEQAEQELLSVIRAKPKAYQLRFSLAKLYQTTKQPEEAGRAYQIGTKPVRTD